jgi:hypothetical protein
MLELTTAEQSSRDGLTRDLGDAEHSFLEGSQARLLVRADERAAGRGPAVSRCGERSLALACSAHPYAGLPPGKHALAVARHGRRHISLDASAPAVFWARWRQTGP